MKLQILVLIKVMFAEKPVPETGDKRSRGGGAGRVITSVCQETRGSCAE